jgi:hypothetical protein
MPMRMSSDMLRTKADRVARRGRTLHSAQPRPEDGEPHRVDGRGMDCRGDIGR